VHFTSDNFEAGVFLGAYGSSLLPQACERLSGTHKYKLVSGLSGGAGPMLFIVAKSHHLFILALPSC
jgi:hypothetical protein